VQRKLDDKYDEWFDEYVQNVNISKFSDIATIYHILNPHL